MNKYHRRRKKPHIRKRIPFWEGVKRFGFISSIKFEFRNPRKYPKYPIWFIPMLISMVILAIILYYYPIEYLPILFYIFELIVVGYMMYRLIKRFDRIRIGRSLLRIWGLRLLSGLISIIGIYIIYMVSISFFFTSIELLLNQQSMISQIVLFGNEWNTPFVIPFMLLIIGCGLLFIGGYLIFIFKIKSGNVIWVGRI